MFNSYLNDLNNDDNYQSFIIKIPFDDDSKLILIIDNEKIRRFIHFYNFINIIKKSAIN